MYKQSESISNVAAALVLVQGELREASFNSTNPHFKNDYASLEAFIEIARPVLAKYGCCLVSGAVADNQFETTILHKSGEWLSYSLPLILSKNDMQGLGSAITYARRYALSAILNMGDKDDDGELSVGRNGNGNGNKEVPKVTAVKTAVQEPHGGSGNGNTNDTPACPECGSALKQSQFNQYEWYCSNYPKGGKTHYKTKTGAK